MMENERIRLEEKEQKQLRDLQDFDLKQQKRLKTGKILVVTASVLSFVSAVLALAMAMIATAWEGGAIMPFSMLLIAAASAVFTAFMLAGFNWARDGFLITHTVKAVLVVGLLLRGDFHAYLTLPVMILLLIWTAFYVAEIFVFGFYQPIREYQYDRLTRLEPDEK